MPVFIGLDAASPKVRPSIGTSKGNLTATHNFVNGDLAESNK